MEHISIAETVTNPEGCWSLSPRSYTYSEADGERFITVEFWKGSEVNTEVAEISFISAKGGHGLRVFGTMYSKLIERAMASCKNIRVEYEPSTRDGVLFLEKLKDNGYDFHPGESQIYSHTYIYYLNLGTN